MADKPIILGNSGIQISPMGLGLMQWGDIKISDDIIDEGIGKVFSATLKDGITFFDTAEMYGNGKSEIHLGRCMKAYPSQAVVATKFMPFPWRLSKGELKAALKRSLHRLGLQSVDLYQMHWPIPPVSIKSWMDAMSDVYEEGLIKAAGVSNYSPAQTQAAFDALSKHNIPLSSNQVKFNLLDRRPQRNGLVDLCKQLGVTIIAYSPLELGILTGKYQQNNLPKGVRRWRYNTKSLVKLQPLINKLQQIGEAHGGLTPAKVALNWLICKGAVPIPGARTLSQAQDNVGALGWRLDENEISILDRISEQVTE